MSNQSFLIIHGLGGSGPDHWQTWLANELKERNYYVCYPTFSQFDSPNKVVWLKELNSAIETIPADYRLTVITHSLGCLLWLHYAASKNKRLAKKAVLVAPPSPKIILSEAKTFYPVPLNKNQLAQAAEETMFVHSSNDPYCCPDDAEKFKSLDLPTITLPSSGHINTLSGHGKWPLILDLCLNSEMIFH